MAKLPASGGWARVPKVPEQNGVRGLQELGALNPIHFLAKLILNGDFLEYSQNRLKKPR